MLKLYENLIRPAVFRLPAETAHELGAYALRVGLAPKTARRLAARKFRIDPFGKLKRFGLTFDNPLGVAAGFDKNGKLVNQLVAIGFGFVEVGTITYDPQQGNQSPRMFRLPDDSALINRLGFNNEGAAKVVKRLSKIHPECVLGINIGKNKSVPLESATENYLKSFDLAHPIADYIAVNVSSPNTPDLRDLQHSKNLDELLMSLQARNRALGTKPLLVKIAPDLTDGQIEEIVNVCKDRDVSGVIATNTTVSRTGLKTANVESFGGGGLSGKPLMTFSNDVIQKVYRFSKGRIPIVGVGGIFTAEDAFEKIAAGASLLQAYTGFVYQGITFARDINLGLAEIIEKRGFASIDEAIGVATR